MAPTGHVVRCIHALGRAVQKNYPDFTGPTLGVKEAVKNERTFTEEKLNEARNAPVLANLGSLRTMARLDVARTNSVTFGAEAQTSFHRAPPPPPPPSDEKIEFVSQVRAGKAHFEPTSLMYKPERTVAERFGDLTPSPSKPKLTPENSENVAELANAIAQVALDTAPVVSSLPGLSPTKVPTGPTAEEEAQEWIESVVGEKFLASFGDSLKDGVLLCHLVNKIRPGLIPRIQTSPMPFKQMENITSFLRACRTIGVAEFDLFETVDLFELKNVPLVVKCVHALGRAVQKHVPEFDGPTLGAKIATTNKRSFSPAQMKEAAAAVPILAHGSSRIMERRPFDRSASITFAYDAGVRGLESSAATQTTTTVAVSTKPAPVVEAVAEEAEEVVSTSVKPSNLPKSVFSSAALPTRTHWS